MRTNDKSEERRRLAIYRDAFIRHCHDLLAMGYAGMDAASFQTWEEPAITGELVVAMLKALESSGAPSWAAHFEVSDDPPVNAPGRTGKRRRRVDIEVVKTQRGKRPHFQFEAKRLNAGGSVGKYLGSEGLGLFLAGDYAAAQDDAGMLGYVQVGESGDWAEKIEKTLRLGRKTYKVRNDGDFKKQNLTRRLDQTYRSRHDRATVGRPITVFHTLLRFN